MANSTPTSSADAAVRAAERRPLDASPDRSESEPAWVADELHLLRLVCQITDYEVAGAPDAAGPRNFGIPESPGLPPGSPTR